MIPDRGERIKPSTWMSHKHNLRQHRFDVVIFLNANKHSSSKRRRDLQFSTGSITGWKLQFRSFACERVALFANIFFKRETSDRNRYVANDILSYWWAVSRCIIALVFCAIDAPKQLRADVNYDVERVRFDAVLPSRAPSDAASDANSTSFANPFDQSSTLFPIRR